MRARSMAVAATTFLLGAATTAGLIGSGCGGGSNQAVAQTLPIEFVDMTYAGMDTMSARVGDATLRGVLDGHLAVHPTTGIINGTLTATFDDGLVVQAQANDSVFQLDVPPTTVLVGSDLSDVILVNGQEDSMQQNMQALFEGLQADERPTSLPPKTQPFALYWLMRYSWAWMINAWASRNMGGGSFSPLGKAFWIKAICGLAVHRLRPLLQAGGCRQAEIACAGRRWIMIGGIRVPCDWLLAMCVDGQFVGANNAFEAWLLFER